MKCELDSSSFAVAQVRVVWPGCGDRRDIAELGRKVASALKIPIIGIGAGKRVD